MIKTIQPISGFRQFTKDEVVAIMEAKTAKVSERLERELRTIQDRMHSDVREMVRDQLTLLTKQLEQNAENIRTMMLKRETTEDKLRELVDKNAANIKLLDRNIKSLDQNLRTVVA
tara:strand:- start:919 stop:1266 length:348 start_codon:yes stop_codon:yes gene_type:complete